MSLEDVDHPLRGANLLSLKRLTSVHGVPATISQRLAFDLDNNNEDDREGGDHPESKDAAENDDRYESIKLPPLSPIISSTNPRASAPAGHHIIAVNDMAKHDHFRQEIGHAQTLAPDIQHKSVAASFQQKKGLTKHTVAVEPTKTSLASSAKARSHGNNSTTTTTVPASPTVMSAKANHKIKSTPNQVPAAASTPAGKKLNSSRGDLPSATATFDGTTPSFSHSRPSTGAGGTNTDLSQTAPEGYIVPSAAATSGAKNNVQTR